MASKKHLGAVGRGLIAGAVGTIVMTLSERLEMAVSGRDASQVPGKVGARTSCPARIPRHRRTSSV